MKIGKILIAGLVRDNVTCYFKGKEIGDIRGFIAVVLPEFFEKVPKGYERYMLEKDTTQLIVYLYNSARCGSKVHEWALVELFPHFVETMYAVFPDQLWKYLAAEFDAYSIEELNEMAWRLNADDYEDYISRLAMVGNYC